MNAHGPGRKGILILAARCAAGLILGHGAGCGPSEPPEAGEIRRVFETYRHALLNGDAERAVSLLDARTLARYDEAVEKARSFTREQLAGCSLNERISVYLIRHHFGKQALEHLSGRTFLKQSIKKSLQQQASVAEARGLVRIRVDGDTAEAALPEAPGLPLFFFTRETGHWKFAAWKTFDRAEAILQSAYRASGETEEAFLTGALKSLMNLPVNPAVFDGPLESAAAPESG